MKKTRGHYPYRQALFFAGMKIVGKADKDELSRLSEILADDISKNNDDISKEDVLKSIKRMKIFFCERKPSFSGTAGICAPDRIFVNIELLDLLNSGDINRFKKSIEYSTILHESIHYIQTQKLSKRIYKGHDLVGLVEGFTEKEANRMTHKPRSTVTDEYQMNFQISSYPDCVLIAQQLEALYGHNLAHDFAYHLDHNLIDWMVDDLGGKFTYRLLKELKRSAKGKDIDIESLQDDLMYNFFDSRVNNINGKEAAMQLLDLFRSYGNKRINFYSSNTYKAYYFELLDLFKNKGIEVDESYKEFIEPEYYVSSTTEDRRKANENGFKFQLSRNMLMWSIFPEGNMPKTSDELFQRFNQFYMENKDTKQFEYYDDELVIHLYLLSDGRCGVYSFLSKPCKEEILTEDYCYPGEDKKLLLSCFRGKDSLKLVSVSETSCKLVSETGKEYVLNLNPEFKIDKKELFLALKDTIKEMGAKYNSREERKTSKRFAGTIPDYEEYQSGEERSSR